MIGLELVDTKKPVDRLGLHPPNGELAAQVQAECIKTGLMIEKGGRYSAVVRFLPPLIITKEECDKLFDIFAAALKKMEKEHGY